MQSLATAKEKTVWRSAGAVWDRVSNIWVGPKSNPCLPKHVFPYFAKSTHGLDHVSKGEMLEMINQFWFTRGFSVVAQKHCEACLIRHWGYFQGFRESQKLSAAEVSDQNNNLNNGWWSWWSWFPLKQWVPYAMQQFHHVTRPFDNINSVYVGSCPKCPCQLSALKLSFMFLLSIHSWQALFTLKSCVLSVLLCQYLHFFDDKCKN